MQRFWNSGYMTELHKLLHICKRTPNALCAAFKVDKQKHINIKKTANMEM